MAFDADLLSLMASQFTHEVTTGHDGFGAPEISKTTTGVPCHVTFANKMVRGDREESATSSAQIQCPPAGMRVGNVTVPEIGVDDHVILADGIERRVLQIRRYTDDTDFYHQSADLT